MSKLLKSKILLGVMVFAVIFAGFALASKVSATECDLGAVTLKQGMSGTAVTCLQTKLAVTPMTGYFGSITKGKVMAFQTANSLTPVDGIVGPVTKAALGMVSGGGTFPAGCASGTGFSTTTGLSCALVGLPAGCTSTTGFSPSTGASCASGIAAGPLQGGAGDVDSVDQVTTSVKNEVLEDEENVKVLGFDIAADNGSDLAISSIRVEFEQQGAVASDKLERYVDEVSVWLGSTKVGSANADDFSESNDVYSKSITLSNVVVEAGEDIRLYVAVTANSTIDSNDQVANDWIAELISIRTLDASGAIITFDPGSFVGPTSLGVFNDFGFADLAGSGDLALRITKDTSSPAIGSVEADANGDTEATMLVFKLKAEASDMTVDSMTFDLTQTTPGAAVLADFVSEVKLLKGSDEIDSVTVANFTLAGVGLTDTVVFTDLADDLTIEDGDTATLKVVAVINPIGAPLTSGETLKVDLTAANTAMASMDVEDENGDQVGDGTGGTSDDRTGSAVGAVQTFEVDTPTVSLVSKSLALFQAIDGIGAGQEDIFLAKFVFNVTAAGDDIYLTKGMTGDEASYDTAADEIQWTQLGAGLVTSYLVEADDETLDDGLTSSFLIAAGTTEKFTVSMYVTANDTIDRFAITSLAYGTADDAAVQYEYNSAITSNMTSFVTSTVYLAK